MFFCSNFTHAAYFTAVYLICFINFIQICVQRRTPPSVSPIPKYPTSTAATADIPFVVEASSGRLFVNGAVSGERQYDVTVLARDESTLLTPSTTLGVQVVTDVPDRSPRFVDAVDFRYSAGSCGRVDVNRTSEPLSDPTSTIATESAPLTVDSKETVDYQVTDDVQVTRKRAKKGQANEQAWKRFKAQGARMAGQSYEGRQGKAYLTKAARYLAPRCNCKLSQKQGALRCHEFSDDERQAIFDSFWCELDWEQRKVFVASMVDLNSVRQPKGGQPIRRASLKFTLKKDGERKKVCKQFFLATLNIGEWSVYNWVYKAQDVSTGGIPKLKRERDSRNKSQVRNVCSQRKEFAQTFLNSLPKMESHYCRSTTSKLYLEPIWRSQLDLYREYCAKSVEAGLQPINRVTFVRLVEDLNIGLFSPKKDQCDLCCAYESRNVGNEEYEIHQCKKELARLEKHSDKTEKRKVFTMDLQSVLLAPRLQASALYYKTKLCIHNFTVFDLHTKDGVCYMWHEGEGGLSANEFATIICSFVDELETKEGDDVTLWSDGCTYQNRNSILANALLSVAMKKKITIFQKYLVRGHTQMECDSMHSTIERRLAKSSINVPADYELVFRAARIRPSPYTVRYLDHGFFRDYSKLQYYSTIRPGSGVGAPVVTDVVALCYKPSGVIHYKLNFVAVSDTAVVKPLYCGSLSIKTDKFVHLQQLKKVIKKDYHLFYDSLKHNCTGGPNGCPHLINHDK